MAATWQNPQVESVSASLTGDLTNPYNLHVEWHAQLIADGSPVVVAVDVPLATTDPLVQADWDTIWSSATTDFNAAAGGTTTDPNPVSI